MSIIRFVAAVKKRTYRTTIRRGDAPALICAAAYRLFTTKGYLATSIEDIAAAAGVARPTVFSAVGPKPAILKAVIDSAAAGDDAPLAVSERPWWKEATDEPDPRRSLRLHARNMRLIAERTAPLVKAVEAAAAADPDARRLFEQFQRQRRTGMAEFVAGLRAKTPLRVDAEAATDMLWMLAPDAYWRLVHDAGWSLERYKSWLADLLERVLLE
jgi:AcrR family transcriptional regulator